MKELAGYLFHGLKFIDPEGELYDIFSMSIYGISLYSEALGASEEKPFNVWANELGYFPVLRDLKDLTKEIKHKGEVFVPCEVIHFTNVDLRYLKDRVCGALRYAEIIKLQEWMFDIHGLIDQGKAISVHDLKVNPYE